MKKRVSATVDEKTEKEIEKILKEGTYRNKSHIIEEAIKLLAEEVKNG
jgi:Arc/MetJ-type ribon-helix-helix transcriptional regulator